MKCITNYRYQRCRLVVTAQSESLTSEAEWLENVVQDVLPFGDRMRPD